MRTTPDAVKGIINVEEGVDLTPFIQTASNLVDRVQEADSTISESTLEIIERWLSAHFYALYKPRPLKESVGSANVTLQPFPGGKGLESTPYGQTALSLDPTGVLKSLSKGKTRVFVQWVGKFPDTS